MFVQKLKLKSLTDEEEKMFRRAGVSSAGLDRLIHAMYAELGLITYFTVGPRSTGMDDKKGYKSATSRRVIHTDFERGFIRAETIAYDYNELKSEKAAKEQEKCAKKERSML